MAEELSALTTQHTWDVVDLPSNKIVVGCNWVYKIKTQEDGSIDQYKARLVAKGFTQEYGIDYDETFALVARLTSIQSLLAIATARKWKLFQMDVKNAFLNGNLSEDVYIQPPPWFSKFSSTIVDLGSSPALMTMLYLLEKLLVGEPYFFFMLMT
ncbi:UNVERIFIED_CONTAM: Retrovirus-related Pol polyprotein from transposon RE1 [Sesamum calycinum]|uniref:Retrovirus-related Pol polyprotein from transposon RE1 n=1 Tax=Sesamum calycinum TaxID=2727403 RepID=A0AAW2L7J3_9LAMI